MHKNFNKFTLKAQEALQNAQELAASSSHGEFKALHLLSSLLADESTLVRPLLSKSTVDLDELEMAVEDAIVQMPKVMASGNIGQLYLSQELMAILAIIKLLIQAV